MSRINGWINENRGKFMVHFRVPQNNTCTMPLSDGSDKRFLGRRRERERERRKNTTPTNCQIPRLCVLEQQSVDPLHVVIKRANVCFEIYGKHRCIDLHRRNYSKRPGCALSVMKTFGYVHISPAPSNDDAIVWFESILCVKYLRKRLQISNHAHDDGCENQRQQQRHSHKHLI